LLADSGTAAVLVVGRFMVMFVMSTSGGTKLGRTPVCGWGYGGWGGGDGGGDGGVSGGCCVSSGVPLYGTLGLSSRIVAVDLAITSTPVANIGVTPSALLAAEALAEVWDAAAHNLVRVARSIVGVGWGWEVTTAAAPGFSVVAPAWEASARLR